ncbi:antileukoproteinase [Fukomys damarensis]|uniref:Antileukoproteinase n=1 Tax=Fukomys damarensis TaxID=885580 RepID=A0A091DDQ6_FUKDA|nr:antileukoproteinase [Fukomys damarensis]KFO30249.1 Antileukoproteinase [Fukomys damarensis]
MKSMSLFFLVVFLALGTLETLAAEGSRKRSQKAGACPPRKQVVCIRYEKPECKSDWQCPGEKKCCTDYCGIKCLDPVDISKSGRKKPGKCPVTNAECLMLNPPNFCEKDGQCEGKLKCCKGMCGKACIPPQ